jgi:hypothetical protein
MIRPRFGWSLKCVHVQLAQTHYVFVQAPRLDEPRTGLSFLMAVMA